MMESIPWTSRTFHFDQPVEIAPVLLARLLGAPARAADLVADLPERVLSARVDNKWSVKEHLGHLADLQPLDERRLSEFLAGAGVLSSADMENRATENAHHNLLPITELLSHLRSVRHEWVAALAKLSESDFARVSIHPRLRQPMRLLDWLQFVAEHDDHHLARVARLIQTGLKSATGSFKDLFAIPDAVTYLNCANMAPQLRSVTAKGLETVRQKTTPWTLSPADWFSGAEELRSLAGRVLGADAGSIAIVPGVSYGIALAAANVAVKMGNSILIIDQEFPSNVYAWRKLAAQKNARLITAQRSGSESWTDSLLGSIDEHTSVVSVPQCHWTDGACIDLVRVSQRAREVGAALVVDASQSLGASPLDLQQIQPDFLVSVGYKWLLGPYGIGYLYASPKWCESGEPLEQSWLTRQGSEDFSRLIDYRDDYRHGARRFDMGEFPQFVLLPMAATALEQILWWGIDSIHARLSRLTDQIADRALQSGYSVLPPEQRCGHMIGIRPPHGIPATLSRSLSAAQVYVSIRGDSIRIAPHLYNDSADIDRLFEVLIRS